MRELARPDARGTAETEPPPSPSGDDGAEAADCRCGQSQHPEDPQRCRGGHLLPGNQAALVTGERSRAFWREHAKARRELREAIITDAGHDPEDSPPRALELAADSVAQAALVQGAAYQRMLEAGGPLTSAGRTRRAFAVWVQATDRLERHLRLVGLKSAPKPTPSLAEYLERRGSDAEQERS